MVTENKNRLEARTWKLLGNQTFSAPQIQWKNKYLFCKCPSKIVKTL